MLFIPDRAMLNVKENDSLIDKHKLSLQIKYTLHFIIFSSQKQVQRKIIIHII